MYHYSLLKSKYTEKKISALLEHILYVILEHGEQEEICILSGLVLEIEQYILNNYTSSDLSNETIAKKYNYNSFYLNLIFKKTLNITMHQYVLSLRIKLAKRLIRETEKTMTDIAMEVGFNSSSYFAQVFRKTQGCSPAEYRKAYIDS
jgi:two-component system response regulator YesN